MILDIFKRPCENDVDMMFYDMEHFTDFIQSYHDYSCDDDFPDGYHSVRLRIDFDI